MVGSYNRAYIIEETIKALIYQDYPKDCYEIILVDNMSTDNSIEIVNKCFKNQISSGRLKILPLIENSGSAGTYNHALNLTNRDWDYFLKMDEDLVLDNHCLSALVDCAERHPDAGMVGGKVYFYKQRNFFHAVGSKLRPFFAIARGIGVNEYDNGQFNKEKIFEGLNGCMTLISRNLNRKIGWFDADYFLYYDDHDLMLRSLRAGFKHYFTPEAVGYHDTSTGSSQKYVNPNWLYYSIRGSWMFFHKNYSLFTEHGILFLMGIQVKFLLSIIMIIRLCEKIERKMNILIAIKGYRDGLFKKTVGKARI